MRTREIAELAKVHPNTVHLYEDWGFISPVPRLVNGYRNYSLTHAFQMKVARLAFRQAFIQNNLRKMATEIAMLVGKLEIDDAYVLALQYVKHLQSELFFSEKAVCVVNELLQVNEVREEVFYTHKQVSEHLQLTQETLRNWERNGLYSVRRNRQKRRQYSKADMNKLLIIRTLRSAHFSISSIYQLVVETHKIKGVDDIKSALNSSQFQTDFFHVTDALQENLNKAIADIESVIALLKSYISGDLSLASLSTIS